MSKNKSNPAVKNNKKRLLSRTVFLCLLCAFSMTGCWDGVALEQRGLVIAMGLDRESAAQDAPDTSHQYAVTLSLPNPKAMTAGGDDKQTLKKTTGQTIPAAISLVDAYANQRLYFGQTRVCVFGQALLSNPDLFREALDALARNRDLSRKVILLAAETEAADIVGAETPEAPLAGLFIANFYTGDTQEKSAAKTFRLDLESFTRQLRESGNGSGLLPKITATGEGLRFGGAAVVKGYALAGWLSESSVRGFLWYRGEGTGALLTARLSGIDTPVEITKQNARCSFYEADGKLCCTVDIRAEGRVAGYRVGGTDFLFNETALKAIEADCAKIIADELSATHLLFKDTYGYDGFGLRDRLEKDDYALFLRYKDRWPAAFGVLTLTPRVTVTLQGAGAVK